MKHDVVSLAKYCRNLRDAEPAIGTFHLRSQYQQRFAVFRFWRICSAQSFFFFFFFSASH